MTHEPNNEAMFADPNRPAGDQLVIAVSGDVTPLVQGSDVVTPLVKSVDAVPIVSGQVVASPDQAAFAPADGSVVVDPNARLGQPNPDAPVRTPLRARLASRKKVSSTGSAAATPLPLPTDNGDDQPSLYKKHAPAKQAAPAPIQLPLTTALPRLDAGNAPAATPNAVPVATPNAAPTPSTPNTMPIEEVERRRDLFMATEAARIEYVNATVANRIDSNKKSQAHYEKAVASYEAARDECVRLHFDDVVASGKTVDEARESVVKVFIEDTANNERVIYDAMLAKAQEAQAEIDREENPQTRREKMAAANARFYKMWTAGSGEKLLSKAGFKNRWKRSAITAAATFVPGVAIGAAATTVLGPLVGAGLVTLAVTGAARGALKGGVSEYINRRAEKWHQGTAANPAVTIAEKNRDNIIAHNEQLAEEFRKGNIDNLSTADLIYQDDRITGDYIDQAKVEQLKYRKELRKKVAIYAGSSIVGVTVGVGLRWVAGHGMEFASEGINWVRNRNVTLPSKASTTLDTVTSTTSSPNTTVTTHAPTTTATTVPTTNTTVPTTPTTIPEAQPAPPVVTELPSAPSPNIDPNAKVLAELQAINADPTSKAAFDQMVHNQYEFGRLQNYADSIRMQHPEMTPAQIDQMTLDGLNRAHTAQIHQYLGGMKALEDQSGLKVGSAEFDQYASNKINEISAAEFVDTKGFIGGRIVNSGLTDLQKNSLYDYAKVDSLPNYTKAHSILSKTVADYQAAPRPELNAMIVQNMNTAIGTNQIADLKTLYDDDEIAEMLLTYYGINV